MDGLLQRALVLGCLGIVVSPAAAERSWSVERGDTLTSIAHRFSVSVRDTMERNGLTSEDIREGQTLVIGPPTGDAHEPQLDDREPGQASGQMYTVARGDTLSDIADRFGMSMSQLLERNPSVSPDRIRVGQRLQLDASGTRTRYRVRRGDTLTRIARHFQVTTDQLAKWNAGLSPERLRTGQVLVLHTDVPQSSSESVGTPSAGKLLYARSLRPHRAYRIRDRSRAWGTAEAVHHVRAAFDRLLARFPKGPAVEVHDLSYKHGGPISHHRSHQSGRDVDIAYFRTGCARKGCDFRPISPKTLDVRRQWALVEQWLKRDVVEAIFIDYSLQKELYRLARKQGASRSQLQRWFQYPRGRGSPLGVIRHFRKHRDHMHVRFACHTTDKRCRSFRPFLMHEHHASR